MSYRMVKQPPNTDTLSAPSLAAPPPPPSRWFAALLVVLSLATACVSTAIHGRANGLALTLVWLGWFIVAMSVMGCAMWWADAPRGAWRGRS